MCNYKIPHYIKFKSYLLDLLKLFDGQVVFHCQVDHSCMVSSIKWFHTTQDNDTKTLVKVTPSWHPQIGILICIFIHIHIFIHTRMHLYPYPYPHQHLSPCSRPEREIPCKCASIALQKFQLIQKFGRYNIFMHIYYITYRLFAFSHGMSGRF